jgi:hypothetical protein
MKKSLILFSFILTFTMANQDIQGSKHTKERLNTLTQEEFIVNRTSRDFRETRDTRKINMRSSTTDTRLVRDMRENRQDRLVTGMVRENRIVRYIQPQSRNYLAKLR